MMKQILLILCLITSLHLIGQERPVKEVFRKIIQSVQKSNSTLSDSSLYVVDAKNDQNFTMSLSSIDKNSIETTRMSLELDFNQFDDTYAIPSSNGTTVIASFKSEVLITKTKTEFENLFHEEIVTEDLNEAAEIWFNFKNENDANDFEKQLSQFKNLLNSN